MHWYLISSLRGHPDEQEVVFRTAKVLSLGEIIVLDGIKWIVLNVVEEERS